MERIDDSEASDNGKLYYISLFRHAYCKVVWARMTMMTVIIEWTILTFCEVKCSVLFNLIIKHDPLSNLLINLLKRNGYLSYSYTICIRLIILDQFALSPCNSLVFKRNPYLR